MHNQYVKCHLTVYSVAGGIYGRRGLCLSIFTWTKSLKKIEKIFWMKGLNMLTVEEIKIAIDSLPEKEYASLWSWFSEKDWEKWDSEIVKDSEAGKLDFLIQEALHEKNRGTLRDL